MYKFRLKGKKETFKTLNLVQCNNNAVEVRISLLKSKSLRLLLHGLSEWEKTMPSLLTESIRAGHMQPMLLPPSGCSGYCRCPSTNQHSREVGIWQRRFDLTQLCLWRQAPLWPDNYLKHLHRWWQSIRWGLITQYTAVVTHNSRYSLRCDYNKAISTPKPQKHSFTMFRPTCCASSHFSLFSSSRRLLIIWKKFCGEKKL